MTATLSYSPLAPHYQFDIEWCNVPTVPLHLKLFQSIVLSINTYKTAVIYIIYRKVVATLYKGGNHG